jgi:hypothetical protein
MVAEGEKGIGDHGFGIKGGMAGELEFGQP